MPVYDGTTREEWLNGLKETSEYNVRHLLSAFALMGIPKSYLDVGCGDGAMVVMPTRKYSGTNSLCD